MKHLKFSKKWSIVLLLTIELIELPSAVETTSNIAAYPTDGWVNNGDLLNT